MVRQAIDEYVDKKQNGDDIDARLEDVVNRMFDRCQADKQYKQGLGIALESRRLDKVQEFINASGDRTGILDYALKCATTVGEIKQKKYIFN